MMRWQSFLGGVMLAVLALPAVAQQPGDTEAITATIQQYFEGTRKGDRRLLEQAFLGGNVHMKHLTQEKGKDVVKSWADGKVLDILSAEEEPELKGHMLSINVYAPTAAFATFDFNGKFVDGFQLLKVNGQWRILNKTYVKK